MRITTLTITNWMAFAGTQRLELPALPIAIVGRYDDNARRSNWAGKTALLESIGWALHGSHRKRTEDALIHYGEAAMTVEVVFDTGETVRRHRPRGGPSVLTVTIETEESKGPAAEELIRKMLGMDEADLNATVVFAQGDTEALVGMRSGERQKVVARWLELERWTRAGDVARKQLRATTDRLDLLHSLVPPAASMTLSELLAERAKLEEEDANLAETELAGDEAADEIRRLHDGDVTDELAAVVARGKAAKERLTALGARAVAPLEELRASETEAAVALGEAKRRADELGDIVTRGFDGHCPVMGEACPADKLVGSTVEQHAHLVDHARAEHARLVQVHRDARECVAAAGRVVQDKAQARADYDASVTRYRELKARADERAARIAEFDTPELREALEAGSLAGTERVSVRGRLTFLTHVEKDIEKRAREAADRAAELDALARSAKIGALVAKALGPTGIAQRIASVQLVALEDRANAMLAGTGLSFSFGWERETKDPAPTCFECGHVFRGKSMKPCPSCTEPRAMKRSDELEIVVDDGSGELEDVRAKSGGARVLVASAIRLAGGAMLRDLKGSRVAWSIVDEPFGPLDAENRESLARTFAGMLGSVGLEQAFVVSHDAALLDALPARIVVHREGKSSRAEVEM